jgi:environmental stress-induced protein Ves
MIPDSSRVVLPDEWRWMPWRNGGGRTAEIHVEGDAAAPNSRLSLAIIEKDGPFSAWPGVDRTLVWLDGGRLELDINGERRCLERLGERTEFTGENSVDARVVQRTTVLNLMVRRASGWRQVAASDPAATIWIVHAIHPASLGVGDRQVDLPAHATLITPHAPEARDDGRSVIVLALSTA